MKVLMIHNFYQQPGGEDVVYQQEQQLLRQYGHDVITYSRSNHELSEMHLSQKGAHLSQFFHAKRAGSELQAIIAEHKPDVAHFHNTHYMISYGAYGICRQAGVPVVQTLHNYRLYCPAATFFRQGRVCEDCVGKSLPYPAVMHACYRNSRPMSALLGANLAYHRWRGTWQKDIDVFITMTEFGRQKFIDCGLPAEKILVKPNFTIEQATYNQKDEGYLFFAGRLVDYKGINTLLKAYSLLSRPIPLKIAGTGPLKAFVQEQAASDITYLGQLDRQELFRHLAGAAIMIYPSEWYETFGMSIIEAFAAGIPVIAGRLGPPGELVDDGVVGWHFVPGDSDDLARVIQEAWQNQEEIRRRGRLARQRYLERYTPEKNYELLLAAYEKAITHFAAR